MENIQAIMKKIKDSDITSDQTIAIDAALSKAKSEEIPSSELQNVMNYIDLELAHNCVEPEVKLKLENLYSELKIRKTAV